MSRPRRTAVVSAGAAYVSAGAAYVSAGAALVSAGAALVSAGAAFVVATAVACGSSHPAPPATESMATLASKYLAIAKVGNDGLEKVLDGLAQDNLATAQRSLRSAVQVEHQFDHSLSAIAFPPAIEATARALVRANEARAALTTTVAASTTPSQLRQGEQQLDAANASVEGPVRAIRAQLGLPPPATS